MQNCCSTSLQHLASVILSLLPDNDHCAQPLRYVNILPLSPSLAKSNSTAAAQCTAKCAQQKNWPSLGPIRLYFIKTVVHATLCQV